MKLKCPMCKQPVESTGEHFPFCSDRCRLMDLGKWASGQYVVSSPLLDVDDCLIDDSLTKDPSERDDD